MTTLAALLTFMMGAGPPPGLDDSDVIVLEKDIRFLGAIVPPEVVQGKPFELELVYKMGAPLPPDFWTFLHLESLDTKCRLVEDRAPQYGSPPLADGYLRHKVTITVPKNEDCKPTTLEVFTGFWERSNGRRVVVQDPPSLDDRIHAASIVVLAEGEGEQAAPAAFPPSEQRGKEFWAHWRPWWGYFVATLGCALLAFWFARRLRKQPLDLAYGPAPTPRFKWQPWVVTTAVLGIPMLLALLVGRDHIKDDAYISFRYAHNLVQGDGLVFNMGDKLEGFTNFLWTLMMVPFEVLGWDLLQVCEVIGTALVAGLIVYATRVTGLLVAADGGSMPIRMGAWLWTGVWLGTSTSLGHWATSGMEQALAMFLPIVSVWLLWKAPLEDNTKGSFWSGVFMGLGCMTRPEIHLMGFLVGLPLVGRFVWRLVKRQPIERAIYAWFAGLFVIVVPFHLFRYLYFGTLVPNTFYVKTGDSSLVMLEGLKKLREMFSDNAVGVLLVLTPLAFIRRERLIEKLVALAIAVSFMAYIVKVGVDEMSWHRLYLPALPFLVMLAMVGVSNLCRVLADWLPLRNPRARTLVAFAIGWAAVGTWAALDFGRTYRVMGGFNGRGDLTGNHHPDMGKFVTRHDRPGALVAFQDMGSTPYHAPDIEFLDFIGLVDGTVARARYGYGLHAFLATEASRRQPEYDAEMREYFYRRNPEWTILTTYIQGDANMKSTAERFARNPLPESLGDPLKRNGYQFGIYEERFEKSYVHVRTWARSAGYYLSLYRRKDLWDKTPGEVVLDALPAEAKAPGSVQAKLSRDLVVEGSHVASPAKARHETFITTWWTRPGPLEPDVWFCLHVENAKFRTPFDSIPGDFMYPANRWQKGQILEHRVLFQIPAEMPPGTYKVYLGVYRRQGGERFRVLEGPNDGEQRILIGELEIESLNPPFDFLIRPNYPEEQRKYPERILDHGRPRPDPGWNDPRRAQPLGR
ncbi:MAG: hypothetical protein IT385_10235 [Deltaproteobacteria bacterium]|nr:hypothetical protein [Deltaproteobacteria bacterium]